MNEYRVTWEGYYDCEAETEEDAKNIFISYIENEEINTYGRDWKDLIVIQELKE